MSGIQSIALPSLVTGALRNDSFRLKISLSCSSYPYSFRLVFRSEVEDSLGCLLVSIARCPLVYAAE